MILKRNYQIIPTRHSCEGRNLFLEPKLCDSGDMRRAKYLIIKSLQKTQTHPQGATSLFGSLFKSEN